jgi:hypothetical protein
LGKLPDVFADHFKSIVDNIITQTELNKTIFNAKQKIMSEELNFISKTNQCVSGDPHVLIKCKTLDKYNME